MKMNRMIVGGLMFFTLTAFMPQQVFAENLAPKPQTSDTLSLDFSSPFLSLTYRHFDGDLLFPHLSITKPWGNVPAEGSIGVGYYLFKEQRFSLLGETKLNLGSIGAASLEPKLTLSFKEGLFSASVPASYKFPLNDLVKRKIIIGPAKFYYSLNENWQLGTVGSATLSTVTKVVGKVKKEEEVWSYKLGPTVKYKLRKDMDLEFWYLKDIHNNSWETKIGLTYRW